MGLVGGWVGGWVGGGGGGRGGGAEWGSASAGGGATLAAAFFTSLSSFLLSILNTAIVFPGSLADSPPTGACFVFVSALFSRLIIFFPDSVPGARRQWAGSVFEFFGAVFMFLFIYSGLSAGARALLDSDSARGDGLACPRRVLETRNSRSCRNDE